MFVHTILLNWHPGTTEDAIDNALRSMVALPTQVPGIDSVYAGRNYSRSSSEYSHVVALVAESQTALTNCDNHIIATYRNQMSATTAYEMQ